MKEINDMELEDGIFLIIEAFEKEREHKSFQLYTSVYPNMSEDNFISFEEFYNPQQPQNDRPQEDILTEVKGILNKNKGNWAA